MYQEHSCLHHTSTAKHHTRPGHPKKKKRTQGTKKIRNNQVINIRQMNKPKPKSQRSKRKNAPKPQQMWTCTESKAREIFQSGPDIPRILLHNAMKNRGFFKKKDLSPNAAPYTPPLNTGETKEETPPPAVSLSKKVKKKKKARKKQKITKKWWKNDLDKNVVDPISLDPICDLSYPPFEIISKHTNNSGDAAEVKHYFDGQFLAHYAV